MIVLLFTVRERLTEYSRNRKVSMSLWTAITLCIESYVTRSTRYCHSRSIDRSITDLRFALADFDRHHGYFGERCGERSNEAQDLTGTARITSQFWTMVSGLRGTFV